MPQLLRLNDFSGGLRTDVAANLINDNESPSLRNVWTFNTGTLRKRGGFKNAWALGGTGDGITTIRAFLFREPGQTRYRYYFLDAGATSANFREVSIFGDFGGTTALPMAGPFSTQSRMIRFNGNIYVSEMPAVGDTQQAGLLKYTGSLASLTRVANSPRLGTIVVHKNHVFGGNVLPATTDTAIVYRVLWSALRNPELWPVNNFIEVNLDDGNDIVQLATYRDSLIIFKGPRIMRTQASATGPMITGSMWKLIGDIFDPELATNPYELRKIDTPAGIGTIFPDSIVEWNGLLTFLTNNGMYVYDGQNILNISEKIRGSVRNWNFRVPFASGQSVTNIEPQSISFEENLWFTVAENDATDLNSVYIFTKQGIWWRFTFPGSIIYRAFFVDERGKLRVIALRRTLTGILTAAIIYTEYDPDTRRDDRATSGTSSAPIQDNSVGIDAMWTSKIFDFKVPTKFDYAYVNFQRQLAGTLRFEVSIDNGPFEGFNISMTGTSGGIKRSPRQLIGKKGRTIQFRVSNAEANVDMEIHEIELYGNPTTVTN